MILYGSELVKKLRADFDAANNRIWIMVPFIGEWSAIKKIMGTKWIRNNQLDIKIITDTRNDGFINAETIKQFLNKAEVKSLSGLHAKIYIIDNIVYITSANLTGTAFSKRYEICQRSEINNNHDIVKIFNDWWKKSKKVHSDWQPKKSKKGAGDSDYDNTSGLKKLWDLPETSITIKNFKDYQDNFLYYNNLLFLYNSSGKRLLPELTEYHEFDAFLNYLFHEHQKKPSFKYLREKKYRKISDSERVSEIKKYKGDFKMWLKQNPTYQDYRKNGIISIQKILAKNKIAKLDWDALAKVVGNLHSMKSLALNRSRFLNPANNKIETIRESFMILLYDERSIEERMEICNEKLRFFGKSSIRELVSWYYPSEYPTINRNTNSGLKFLGYDVKTY